MVATVYGDDLAAQARLFAAAGATHLHVVDLDGAFAGASVNGAAVESIIATFPGQVQVGGGIRDRAGVDRWLALGVARVIIGTAALKDPEFVKSAARDLPGRIVVGVDARDGMIATEGWADVSDVRVEDLARRFEDAGVAALLFTDVGRDGLLKGCNVEATVALAQAVDIPVIASGGVADIHDIHALRPHVAEGARGRDYRPRAVRRPARSGRGDRRRTGHDRPRPRHSLSRCRQWPRGQDRELRRPAAMPATRSKQARAYDAAGADELMLPRHHGQPSRRAAPSSTWSRRTAEVCFMPLTVGGGVRSAEDARALLLAGADKVAVNSAAVARPELVADIADRGDLTARRRCAAARRWSPKHVVPTAGVIRPASTRSNTPSASRPLAPANCS